MANIAFASRGEVCYNKVSQKRRYEEIRVQGKKLLTCLLVLALLLPLTLTVAEAATVSYTVVRGDSLWKIAVRHEVGLSEIKAANPTIKNYNLIYPGQRISIPLTDSGVTAYENEVVRLVNKERQERGLKGLSQNWELARVARIKSRDMQQNGYFSHNSPVYGSPFQMMKSFGISYRSAGENIAKGYATPEAVVNAWMRSEGHRANILSNSFTEIGVGYVANGHYATQLFRSV
ncbi:MAG: LysM peptidoglycan-binding domain-containing protein [Clostridia bacterium]|nr:LysM peptidoglycan-binding domain-containing protein [Clostridia bacterium]